MPEYKKSCQQLQKAIASLSQYIQKTQKKLTKHPRLFLSKLFLRGISKKKQAEENSFLQTIDLIKSHRWLIQQLQKGTEEQKKLAATSLQVISQYNEIASKLRHKANLWEGKIPEFLKEKIPFPDLPSSHPIELSLPVTRLSQTDKQVQLTAETSDSFSSSLLTLEEKNAFRMKGISLLKAVGNPYFNIARTQKEVLNAPIALHVDSLSKKMSLSTTLSPLPGENYTFKGSFKCLPGGKRSLPLGKSFEISTEATQTAFPDPVQYLGCFSNALIPPCPHRVQEVKPLAKVLEKKANLASALLPNGEYNQIAKEQLEKKKNLFNTHRHELIPLHQQLMQHLTGDSHPSFFTPLFQQENALEQLAQIYRQFTRYFIEAPFHHLQHQWLEKNNPSPFCLNKKTNQVLKQLRSEKKSSFLISLGEVLSAPCHSILKQHLSESLKFCPPLLTEFEKKVQRLIYRQLLTFFRELEERIEPTLEWMKSHMEAEIALFTTPLPDDLTNEALHLCEKQEEYFHTRYQRS